MGQISPCLAPFHFLFSLLIHLAVAFSLFYSSDSFEKPKTQSRITVIPAEIKITKSGSQSRVLSASPKGIKRPTRSKIPLSKLGIQYSTHSTGESTVRLGDLSSDSGFEGADAMETLTHPDSMVARYVFQKVDQNLAYPSEFVQRKFQGPVTVRAYFDEEGFFEKDSSLPKASNPYLRVYVARVLRKALMEPIPKTLLGEGGMKRRVIDCLFNFEITSHNDEMLVAQEKFFSGKNVFFYRHHYISKLEWSLGPFSGLGPFAVGLDVNWIIGSTGRKKAPSDPLQKYRDDPAW